ncbi:hypothetical protein FNF27_00795 [Cafeteria roenbergensis]|uniref:Ubiquitin-related modifier 1 homolog n=1 Tax=Cafeteria roenbergensis TaxID=33653 RepID=A0A5A8D6X1_CAFRO|nr:hypothetical protein FNF31_04057 [Cafeteria roenbergensis]KAA0164553.1 hypothetical protein FNF28_03795 [Cafeteria roenbergensis]KAA0177625.1 hypothetical protein FNF27_00795 [Cafeteria roenbergensis]
MSSASSEAAGSAAAKPLEAAADAATPTEAAAVGDVRLAIELSGGLELLFGQVKRFDVVLSRPTGSGADEPLKMRGLLTWMRENLLKERPELFLGEGDALRAGILCLVNDADWELGGTMDHELEDGDEITFISTLHGG